MPWTSRSTVVSRPGGDLLLGLSLLGLDEADHVEQPQGVGRARDPLADAVVEGHPGASGPSKMLGEVDRLGGGRQVRGVRQVQVVGGDRPDRSGTSSSRITRRAAIWRSAVLVPCRISSRR